LIAHLPKGDHWACRNLVHLETSVSEMVHFSLNRKKQNAAYRRGVGIVLFNRLGKVFVGQRIDTQSSAWQMPQGGIDADETPEQAAWREMLEEIGTNKAKLLAESQKWFTYDLPSSLKKTLWKGRYRGQRQKWFAFLFLGNDNQININTSNPEFREWRWVDFEQVTELIVPFKKPLYENIIHEFAALRGVLADYPKV
jgi:putative (di)nucleoside polyphosphate hydrolase